jgi:hypothetical protein
MGIMSEDTAYTLIQKACEAIEHKGIIQQPFINLDAMHP